MADQRSDFRDAFVLVFNNLVQERAEQMAVVFGTPPRDALGQDRA